ncbi:MAG: glycerophosphodiester phosphodiesterase family protein [Ignavibacteriales bacterium]|nr:glycerophosphodiester phosphodiesterase family protein [Ignavibacteriales bacterium]
MTHIHHTAPLVIAHRGYSAEAPENTLAAFRKAAHAGADMIELDVRLSADDKFVVIHDRRLERTTAQRGLVRSFSSDELCALDNGSWFSRRFAKERVPLLEDVFSLSRRGAGLNIEIKPDVLARGDVPVHELAIELVKKEKMARAVIFSSFNHKIVRALKKYDESIPAGLLYNPIKHFRRSPAQLATATGADMFICSKYQLSAEVVDDAHSAGIGVFVYGITSERDVRRCLRLNVDALIANDPVMVRKTIASEMKKISGTLERKR